MSKKSKLGLCAVFGFCLALYFFMWFIQTAWLGSFPGRNVSYYAFWAYSQLAASILLFLFACISLILGLRIKEPVSDA